VELFVAGPMGSCQKTSFITTTVVTTFRAREEDRERARARYERQLSIGSIGLFFNIGKEKEKRTKGREVRHGRNTVYLYSTILVLKSCLGRRNCYSQYIFNIFFSCYFSY
jgi:hypothetical protein